MSVTVRRKIYVPAIKLENVGMIVVPLAIEGTEGPLVFVHARELIEPSESLSLAPEMTTELVGSVIGRSMPAFAVGATLAAGLTVTVKFGLLVTVSEPFFA